MRLNQRSNLVQALSEFISEEDLVMPLASVLSLFWNTNVVSRDQLITVAENCLMDVLLLACEWKLILPLTPSKTSAWEDRLFSGLNASSYEMPEAVRWSVQLAARNGTWNVEPALILCFRAHHIPEDPNALVKLVVNLATHDSFVSARDVIHASKMCSIKCSADFIISTFKSLGIISPKLSNFVQASLGKGPLYELNPSLKAGLGKQQS